ncbi:MULTISPECIES: dihydropteroate synthase [Pontibacillus]|uniref:Dihydropteroate synthase n=1 Tax=Pontibacillus chungwhensis TaxID=265426 RepID=A0ABY8V396_9BACI|nr:MULTISPECIES: dihydropteroate synthase [Pontibacillus]MCD5326121.1 dihydropteroate synthase [Pontibacillus sp. HN14]WIG00101.1 dihydropteroate synthase [Pontibacillus chungwhensis]
MGILNVTPDSFSDGGQFDEVEVAIKQAKQMQQDGAHIIDVGGESTRPGHDPVTEQEELKRVLPIIRAVRQEIDIPISIDTYKSEVARQALEAGASIINDVWGAKRDPQMAQVAAAYQVPIILMHNREDRHYANLIEDMKKDLQESIDLAKDAGVRDENILLDPGVGFAKTPEQNVEVMGHLSEVVSLGYPVLLGTSRKSFIGQVLDLPVEERMEGTGATVCYGMTQGIDLVRVHDVKPIARMTKMMDKMLGKGSD